MSETQTASGPTQLPLKDQLKGVEDVRNLFAAAHDLIAQASHPGHMGMRVAEVLNFLKFHYEDFKRRAEGMAGQIEQEAKAELSKVDVEAAKVVVEATLSDEHGSADAPKA
jgi:hypothetical protein